MAGKKYKQKEMKGGKENCSIFKGRFTNGNIDELQLQSRIVD